MQKPLKPAFYNRSAPPTASAAPLRADRILNYAWLNSHMLDDQGLEPGDPLCGVPLHYFDQAYKNARKYPDTEVRIWVDSKYLNELSKFFVQSHYNNFAPPNIRLMDLRSIPRYAKNEDLDVMNMSGVYNRADIARFLILAHTLKSPGIKEAFYADFDVEDVQLDNPVTKSILATRGIALAHADNHPEVMALGYIAVRKMAEDELEDYLLPALEKALYRETGVNVTVEHYFNEAAQNGELTNVPMRPFGWQMPIPEIYTEYGICKAPLNYYELPDLEMD
jgi:hypothetical protein